MAQTVVQGSSITITTEWLESLTKTNNDCHDKHCDTTDYRHGSNSSIAITSCCNIKKNDGNACQSLSRQRRRTAIYYLTHIMPMQREEAWTKTYSSSSTIMAHCKQYNDTNHLSDDGGNSSATQLKTTTEYQDGVENHIEQGSADDAPHSITGIALHAQLVVECE